MTSVSAELPEALENLDEHLKALLRVKLREFVHLGPWFKYIPSIDLSLFPTVAATRNTGHPANMPGRGCPSQARHQLTLRRHVRRSVYCNSLN